MSSLGILRLQQLFVVALAGGPSECNPLLAASRSLRQRDACHGRIDSPCPRQPVVSLLKVGGCKMESDVDH